MDSNDQRYPEWWRRRALRNFAYMTTLRGQTVMRAWPKKYTGPVAPVQQDARNKFKKLVEAQKNAWAVDQVGARAIADGSQYVWRDVIGRACVGRLIEMIPKYEELRLVPIIQDLLLSVSNTPGTILICTGTEYVALAPGNPGSFISWNDEFTTLQWLDPPQSVLPLVNGDINAPGATDVYPGVMHDGSGQTIAVPV